MKALLLVAAVVLAGCSGPESSLESCIAEYSQPGKTKQLVRAGYANCKVALDTARHPIERSRAMCIASQVTAVNVEQGLRVLYSECEKKHPTPECPSGQRFSFPADACADICKADELYQPGQYPECIPAPPPGFERTSMSDDDRAEQVAAWTQESTGSKIFNPMLENDAPRGTRYSRMADGTIYRLFPPGTRPGLEPANPFALEDSSVGPPS